MSHNGILSSPYYRLSPIIFGVFLQCRIVESILTNVEWFFECDDTDVPNFDEGECCDVDMEAIMNNLTSGSGISQSNDALNEISNTMGSHSQLLLSNLQKLEESGKVSSARDYETFELSEVNE